jgi:DNA repair protein RadA/Sms
MAKIRTIYACTECGGQQPRWLGRCPACGSWNTLVEEVVGAESEPGSNSPRDLLKIDPGSGAAKPLTLGEIEASASSRISSNIPELDRVLGGGLVPGSVVLLGGEPGVGKSTLALQLASQVAGGGPESPLGRGTCLYVSGEESAEQIRLRGDRLKESADRVHVIAETRVEALTEPWQSLQPDLVVIDSIQTLHTDRVSSAPGSVAQVRECAALLAATAKAHGAPVVLVGHVTKDGSIAGPRVLEHMVDVVLTFDGDRSHELRLLRAVKNRFGSTQEVGVFQMARTGLECVDNPSELFLAERQSGAPGSCISPLLEGTRPMLVEIQALVASALYGTPRRTCIGVEDARVSLLLAVLDRRSDVDLLSRDVYVNAAGGVRVGEPAADLATTLAIASSRFDIPLPPDVAACGEVGLAGEVRRVSRMDLRAREAARLGFRRLLVPAGSEAGSESGSEAPGRADSGCECVPVSSVAEAVRWLRGSSRQPER